MLLVWDRTRDVWEEASPLARGAGGALAAAYLVAVGFVGLVPFRDIEGAAGKSLRVGAVGALGGGSEAEAEAGSESAR